MVSFTGVGTLTCCFSTCGSMSNNENPLSEMSRKYVANFGKLLNKQKKLKIVKMEFLKFMFSVRRMSIVVFNFNIRKPKLKADNSYTLCSKYYIQV